MVDGCHQIQIRKNSPLISGRMGPIAPSISAWWITQWGVSPRVVPSTTHFPETQRTGLKYRFLRFTQINGIRLSGDGTQESVFLLNFPSEVWGSSSAVSLNCSVTISPGSKMQEEALFIHERPRNCFVECIARQLQDHGMRKSRELSGICFFSVVFSSKKKKILMPKWHILGWQVLIFYKDSLSLSLSFVSWIFSLWTPCDQRQPGERHCPVPRFLRDCAWIGFLERVTSKYTSELIFCMDCRHGRILAIIPGVVPLHPLTFFVHFRHCQSISELSPTRLGCSFKSFSI